MTDEELDALEKVAEAVFMPNDWRAKERAVNAWDGDERVEPIFIARDERDAAHAATFDPPTALRLIRDLREARDRDHHKARAEGLEAENGRLRAKLEAADSAYRRGIYAERKRIIGQVQETTGRRIADGGQYRADIDSSLRAWRDGEVAAALDPAD
tara:strand:- start:335 stop:802 length:468 start_codon:yes stop_codon:yes gene_type:complete